jgi:chorismate-pyruvate lyase
MFRQTLDQEDTCRARPDYHFSPVVGFHLNGVRPESDQNGLDFDTLQPVLRALLAMDGTVTKFLESFFWEPIQVQQLFQGDICLEHDLPALETSAGTPVLKRHVVLRGLKTNQIYAFAESFIRVDRLWSSIREDLLQGRLGIGELLRDRRLETYREVLTYGREAAGTFSSTLQMDAAEAVLYRSYRIYSQHTPIILISEKFPEHRFAKSPTP